MKIFFLPDLGEGLPDAEIIEWYVTEGDSIELDAPLVSMETAKAVVEVPSPYAGKVSKLHGHAGDIVETGTPLAEFEVGNGADEVGDHTGEDVDLTGQHSDATDTGSPAGTATVVGSMASSDTLIRENLTVIHGVKVTPAVRALARKLKVDLARVSPSGKDGIVLRADVENAAGNPLLASTPRAAITETTLPDYSTMTATPGSQWEPIRGTRRAMARIMSESHTQVVPTSIIDDADIHQWISGQDMTIRLLRSLWAGARIEPGLNAWYDAGQNRRMTHKIMDVGMAVDTRDGLFVAALRNVHSSTTPEIRESISSLRDKVESRSIPPADLKDYTIMLSNFGKFAGRYATPVLNPPCVCIVAAGKARDQLVPTESGIETHRVIPLSLTFDHRACTGGEAARFLGAMLDDLALPE